MELKIDELAERAGVTRRTIRYYISSGLLAAPGARGTYGQAHLDGVLAIKRLQAERLSLREIRERLIGDAVLGSISRLSEPPTEAPQEPVQDGASELPDARSAVRSAEWIADESNHVDEADETAAVNAAVIADIESAAPRDVASLLPPDLDSLRSAFAVQAARAPGGGWEATARIMTLLALPVAALALVVAALAFGESRQSSPAPISALVIEPTLPAPTPSDTCVFFTKYADDLVTLSANLLGPDAARQLTPEETKELLRRVDEVLAIRDGVCVERSTRGRP